MERNLQHENDVCMFQLQYLNRFAKYATNKSQQQDKFTYFVAAKGS